MPLLTLILLFTFLGSIASLIGGFILIANKKLTQEIMPVFVPFAAGTLLSVSFFDLLPEALEFSKKSESILSIALLGIILFFLLERYLLWFHHHLHHEEREETKPTNTLIIIGDTLHNFLDGVIISASFLVSVPLGVVTAIAVGLHELPQEISDFGVLLASGMKRKSVILINILSAFSSFAGAVLAFYFLSLANYLLPFLLAFAAGNFIYIASSDLIPEIHSEFKSKKAHLQTFFFITGVLVTRLLTLLLE